MRACAFATLAIIGCAARTADDVAMSTSSSTSDASGTTAGDDTPPPDLPLPSTSVCDDPLRLSPYAVVGDDACLRGWFSFGMRLDPTDLGGPPSYAAGVAFFDVVAESTGSADEVLDPWAGVDDCGLALRGAGMRVDGEVEWEDAGDVVFSSTAWTQPAEKHARSSIYYDLDLSDLGIPPAFGEPHGFTASGATAPAFELDGVALMPEALENIQPTLDGTSVDHENLIVRWTAGAQDAVVDLAIARPDPLTEIFCRVRDDGEFEVPAPLLAQLDLPRDVLVAMRRIALAVVPVEDGRSILLEARAETPLGTLHLQ